MSSPSLVPDPPLDGARPDQDVLAVELLNINEVSTALRVSKMTVYRLIRDGRLPALRLGNSFRVHRSDLDEYMRAAFLSPVDHRPPPEPGGSMSNPSAL